MRTKVLDPGGPKRPDPDPKLSLQRRSKVNNINSINSIRDYFQGNRRLGEKMCERQPQVATIEVHLIDSNLYGRSSS